MIDPISRPVATYKDKLLCNSNAEYRGQSHTMGGTKRCIPEPLMIGLPLPRMR
jgi:hypothetical protein